MVGAAVGSVFHTEHVGPCGGDGDVFGGHGERAVGDGHIAALIATEYIARTVVAEGDGLAAGGHGVAAYGEGVAGDALGEGQQIAWLGLSRHVALTDAAADALASGVGCAGEGAAAVVVLGQCTTI